MWGVPSLQWSAAGNSGEPVTGFMGNNGSSVQTGSRGQPGRSDPDALLVEGRPAGAVRLFGAAFCWETVLPSFQIPQILNQTVGQDGQTRLVQRNLTSLTRNGLLLTS